MLAWRDCNSQMGLQRSLNALRSVMYGPFIAPLKDMLKSFTFPLALPPRPSHLG